MRALEAVGYVSAAVVSALLIGAAVARGLRRFIAEALGPRLDLIEDALLELLDEHGPRCRAIALRIRRHREEREKVS